MFENYANINNSYGSTYGISNHEKKYLKKVKKQNMQNKYGLSSFSNSTINNNIGGLISNSNIEAFGSMNQTQFLPTSQNLTMDSPQTLSGLNFGYSAPNPYHSNSSNTQTVTSQQIKNQIQAALNNQNTNPKNPSNNLTTYTKQSEAVILQNELTASEIGKLKDLTAHYNNLINQYNKVQSTLISNADNQVLSMNSSTNPYLGQNLEISGGQVYYITHSGTAQPYEISPTQVSNSSSSEYGLINAYSQITNTPTNVNSTSAINATVYDSEGTSYINTSPAMEIGNTKYQWYSSGYEGTNVYANNSKHLSFTDASYVGCYNTTISSTQQQPLMSLAPGSQTDNYTFRTCQQVAYDSGSQFFSFNTSSPTSQTGACYISNSQANINTMTSQCPAVNYTYTKLWSTNITPVSGSDMSGNYMSLDPAGNVVIYNSSNIAIWSSDSSNNSLSVTNYRGCYQSSVTDPVTNMVDKYEAIGTKDVTNCSSPWYAPWQQICQTQPETVYGLVPVSTTEQVTVPTMQDVTNSSNNTWETCYQYAYNNGNSYFGVNNFNPANGTSNCLVSNVLVGGGLPNSCSLQDQLYYGGNGTNAVYSVSGEPLNAFLTIQDNGMVSAFTGTTLQDQQNVTWQLNMTGQVQQSNCQTITDASYAGYMQTGQWLYEGDIFSSHSGMMWFTMQGGNLVLYTSSNTPKCYQMTTQNNKTYYTGDISMNALYQSTITVPNQTEYLGNIGYVDKNSILYQYPQNLVGQGNTFTYMGNYDSSGTPITDPSNGSIYWTGFDLSGAMQKCINTPNCNAFISLTTNNGNMVFKFMETAFATPTYSQSSSNYLPRFPNPNAQFFLRNPTVNNSSYCNKSITGINTGLYSNYQTNGQTNGQMNTNMQCVQITTTDPQLNALGQQINNLSSQITTMQNNLMNKTMTVNQQEQLNEIILGRQFKEIDAVQAVQKQSKQNAVNAQNIKNDSNIVVLRENQSYTLWSVLAISIALISIHVIR